MSEPLKPCPFCGGDAQMCYGLDPYSYVMCLDCEAESHDWASERETAAAWNRRASPWINFAERRPEDGQHCWYTDDMTQEPEDAWYHADEQMFQAEPYEIIYPVNAKWFLWQPCEIPAPPTAAEIEEAEGEAK